MFSFLSIIDETVKSVEDTWAVSEKDKVMFRNTTVELIYSREYASTVNIHVSVKMHNSKANIVQINGNVCVDKFHFKNTYKSL